jgi:hypothetical protein
MAVFLAVGMIAGVMLGIRFKVLILGPAFSIATAIIILTGIASSHESRKIALTVFGVLVSLQMGYVACGILQATRLPRRTAMGSRPSNVEIVPIDVEFESASVAYFEPLSSGIHKEGRRHDEHYDGVIDRVEVET